MTRSLHHQIFVSPLFRVFSVLLAVAMLLASFPTPALANPTAQAGLPGIDPNDPHRFVMDGQPWYPSGYYPNIAALTHDQTDYNGYYKTLIDKLAANRINYLRAVFNMGQPYNNAMDLYQRTGPGNAADGKPKFDLTKFNQNYFDYWRKVITYARSKGIVVQLVLLDSWHNKQTIAWDNGGGLVWGMKFDYYNGTNNINGLNTANVNEWHSPSHPVFDYQKEVIRKAVDNLGDLPNIVYEISNENYYNDKWELQLADFLTDYEKSKGFPRHLVMPRDLPNHDNAGAKEVDPVKTHKVMVNNFSKNKPLIADNDGGGDLDPAGRRKRAWAVLTAGAHMSYFHGGMAELSELNKPETGEGMRYIGMVQKFLSDFSVDLRGMRPSDNLVTNGAWALAKSGERYIVYLGSGGSTNVSNLPSDYTATWFNPRDGSSQPAGSGPGFTAPDGKDWVLYIKGNGAQNPDPTPSNPSPGSGQGVVRINFQPAGASTPSGFLADTGSAFGDRGNGYRYGWSADNSAHARELNSPASPDKAYDTLNYLDRGGDLIWEIELPNGTYAVRLVSGDPASSDCTIRIRAEDSLLLSAIPSTQAPWAEVNAIVEVNDGRLTLSNGKNPVNNAVNFIEIRPDGYIGPSPDQTNQLYLPAIGKGSR